MKVVFRTVICLLICVVAAPAMAQNEPVQLQCDQAATNVGGDPGTSVVAVCPAGCNSGAVWGTGLYSDDSHVCVAAVHAGVLDTSGGTVVVSIQPGQPEYPASVSNGITSLHWTAWTRSFTVAAYLGEGAVTADCTTVGSSVLGEAGATVAVTCPAGCLATGAVWGTGAYTDDSTVCQAAIHAGVLTDAGGAFNLTIGGGQPTYPASVQNGVTSSDWGEWGRSFTCAP